MAFNFNKNKIYIYCTIFIYIAFGSVYSLKRITILKEAYFIHETQ